VWLYILGGIVILILFLVPLPLIAAINTLPPSYFAGVSSFPSLLSQSLYDLLKKRERERGYTAYSNIINEIMDIRQNLRENPHRRGSASEKWSYTKDPKNRQLIRDMHDYALIDDFFALLRDRNAYIEREKSSAQIGYDNVMRKLNQECVLFADFIIKQIDWTKVPMI
jgi:hypothetical protein